MKDIILASASGIRLKILNDFGFNVKVETALMKKR
jgi:predicted house-cleaning NTP pyrophosphatase (Maf/HAM1 superfamily)